MSVDYKIQSKNLILSAQYLEGTGVPVVYAERMYKAAESIDELLERAEKAERERDDARATLHHIIMYGLEE